MCAVFVVRTIWGTPWGFNAQRWGFLFGVAERTGARTHYAGRGTIKSQVI